jgi:hypothetical protein
MWESPSTPSAETLHIDVLTVPIIRNHISMCLRLPILGGSGERK